jgi:hypothetical protein
LGLDEFILLFSLWLCLHQKYNPVDQWACWLAQCNDVILHSYIYAMINDYLTCAVQLSIKQLLWDCDCSNIAVHVMRYLAYWIISNHRLFLSSAKQEKSWHILTMYFVSQNFVLKSIWCCSTSTAVVGWCAHVWNNIRHTFYLRALCVTRSITFSCPYWSYFPNGCSFRDTSVWDTNIFWDSTT